MLSAQAVCDSIVRCPWFSAAKTVMAYMAIPPELSLAPVLDAALAQGKQLLLPRCQKDGSMTARLISDRCSLTPGAFGILEPDEHTLVFPKEQIDLILVPALAYDRWGRRLGRGKGYYDRFLTDFPGKTIGVSSSLLDAVPAEPHDIPVDAVATRRRIILCGLEDKTL